MSNTDKIATETSEEAEAFALIDNTASQVEQMAGKKLVASFVVDIDYDEISKFGQSMIANTCEEILKAINDGMNKADLISTLEAAIESNRESAGISNEKEAAN